MDTIIGIPFRYDVESFPNFIKFSSISIIIFNISKEFLTQIVFFMFIEDFSFYWSHRFLHWEKIFPYIHKVHHEYYNTVSIAAEYSHPVEFIVSNIVPTILGAKILDSKVHIVTFFLWLVLRLFETVDGHCGYEFSWSPYRLMPLSGSSIYHNFHHSHVSGNYGSFFTIWDTICGTNKDFYKYLSKREKELVLNELRGEFTKMKNK